MKPIAERLPFQASLTLTGLRSSDYELFINGVVTDAMRRACDETLQEEEWKREKAHRKARREAV